MIEILVLIRSSQPLCPTGSKPNRLRAQDFVAGNKQQLIQLKSMGIQLVTMNDGRIQLLHTATEVRLFTGLDSKKFQRTIRIVNTFLPMDHFQHYVLGAQKNHLIEMVLLSTHNICFG